MTTHSDPKEGTAGELIARLEVAENGSRGLDADIFATTDYKDRRYWGWQASRPQGRPEITDHRPFLLRYAPHYTTSLDAAVTLISAADWDGLDWELKTAPHRHGAIARIIDMETTYRAEAATPALALCIAALKASDGAQQNVAEEK